MKIEKWCFWCKFLFEVFEEELFPQERVETIDADKINDSSEGGLYTAQTLSNAHPLRRNKQYVSSKQRVFCGTKNHISTRCKNIINIETRHNLCFWCLSQTMEL